MTDTIKRKHMVAVELTFGEEIPESAACHFVERAMDILGKKSKFRVRVESEDGDVYWITDIHYDMIGALDKAEADTRH